MSDLGNVTPTPTLPPPPQPSLETLTLQLVRLDLALDKVLREHEVLRTTNRELSIKNRALGKDNASLRRRLTKLAQEKA